MNPIVGLWFFLMIMRSHAFEKFSKFKLTCATTNACNKNATFKSFKFLYNDEPTEMPIWTQKIFHDYPTMNYFRIEMMQKGNVASYLPSDLILALHGNRPNGAIVTAFQNSGFIYDSLKGIYEIIGAIFGAQILTEKSFSSEAIEIWNVNGDRIITTRFPQKRLCTECLKTTLLSLSAYFNKSSIMSELSMQEMLEGSMRSIFAEGHRNGLNGSLSLEVEISFLSNTEQHRNPKGINGEMMSNGDVMRNGDMDTYEYPYHGDVKRYLMVSRKETKGNDLGRKSYGNFEYRVCNFHNETRDIILIDKFQDALRPELSDDFKIERFHESIQISRDFNLNPHQCVISNFPFFKNLLPWHKFSFSPDKGIPVPGPIVFVNNDYHSIVIGNTNYVTLAVPDISALLNMAMITMIVMWLPFVSIATVYADYIKKPKPHSI